MTLNISIRLPTFQYHISYHTSQSSNSNYIVPTTLCGHYYYVLLCSQSYLVLECQTLLPWHFILYALQSHPLNPRPSASQPTLSCLWPDLVYCIVSMHFTKHRPSGIQHFPIPIIKVRVKSCITSHIYMCTAWHIFPCYISFVKWFNNIKYG